MVATAFNILYVLFIIFILQFGYILCWTFSCSYVALITILQLIAGLENCQVLCIWLKFSFLYDLSVQFKYLPF